MRQDGRSASLTAPNGQAQQGLLLAALSDACTVADALGISEAHGTGTKAGDACEFEALNGVYGASGMEQNWCALGSVKSQIGHTKSTAGAA